MCLSSVSFWAKSNRMAVTSLAECSYFLTSLICEELDRPKTADEKGEATARQTENNGEQRKVRGEPILTGTKVANQDLAF